VCISLFDLSKEEEEIEKKQKEKYIAETRLF
jgi:hypothetical protein